MFEKIKYKLTIAYEGSQYSGWQRQPHSLSIQQIIEETLKVFLREEIRLVASGRTDAGVHALGQVAHFYVSKSIDPHRFLIASNGLLPKDIRILSIEEVPSQFHAQYSAIGKIYHYQLWLDKIRSPFHRFTSTQIHKKIDLPLLKEAATLFIGTHDFTSFANSPNKGSASRDPIRTLTRLDIVEQEGGVRLEFEGDGFLYKMVRNITGTLLEVASGKRSVEDIPKIFSSKNRILADNAAPPQGLCLIQVHYPT